MQSAVRIREHGRAAQAAHLLVAQERALLGEVAEQVDVRPIARAHEAVEHELQLDVAPHAKRIEQLFHAAAHRHRQLDDGKVPEQ